MNIEPATDRPAVAFHPSALAAVEAAAQRRKRAEAEGTAPPGRVKDVDERAPLDGETVAELIGTHAVAITFPRPPKWWQITKRWA